MRFFFYGTLMERELLQRVLQRPLLSRSLMAARLTGWRRCAVHGHDFPAVLRCRGSAVDGVVLDHVSSTDREKLIAYEGEGYTTARAVAELANGQRRPVLLFVPKPGFYTLSNTDWLAE